MKFIVNALHHVGVADACGGVGTEHAAEGVTWCDIAGESRGDMQNNAERTLKFSKATS